MQATLWVLQANHLRNGQGVNEIEKAIEIAGHCITNRWVSSLYILQRCLTLLFAHISDISFRSVSILFCHRPTNRFESHHKTNRTDLAPSPTRHPKYTNLYPHGSTTREAKNSSTKPASGRSSTGVACPGLPAAWTTHPPHSAPDQPPTLPTHPAPAGARVPTPDHPARKAQRRRKSTRCSSKLPPRTIGDKIDRRSTGTLIIGVGVVVTTTSTIAEIPLLPNTQARPTRTQPIRTLIPVHAAAAVAAPIPSPISTRTHQAAVHPAPA